MWSNSAKKKMCFIQTSARVYIDYRPATLSIGKVWTIRYYVTDPENGRLCQFRS